MKIVKADAFHPEKLEGNHVVRGEKYLKDNMRSLYLDSEGVPDDLKLYTVYSDENCDPSLPGELYWGLTVLEPVCINGECNMTRGHFHIDRNCAEYYIGVEGNGLLLLIPALFQDQSCLETLHFLQTKVEVQDK